MFKFPPLLLINQEPENQVKILEELLSSGKQVVFIDPTADKSLWPVLSELVEGYNRRDDFTAISFRPESPSHRYNPLAFSTKREFHDVFKLLIENVAQFPSEKFLGGYLLSRSDFIYDALAFTGQELTFNNAIDFIDDLVSDKKEFKRLQRIYWNFKDSIKLKRTVDGLSDFNIGNGFDWNLLIRLLRSSAKFEMPSGEGLFNLDNFMNNNRVVYFGMGELGIHDKQVLTKLLMHQLAVHLFSNTVHKEQCFIFFQDDDGLCNALDKNKIVTQGRARGAHLILNANKEDVAERCPSIAGSMVTMNPPKRDGYLSSKLKFLQKVCSTTSRF